MLYLMYKPSDAARRSCPNYLLFSARSSERSVGRLNVQPRETECLTSLLVSLVPAGERRDLALTSVGPRLREPPNISLLYDILVDSCDQYETFTKITILHFACVWFVILFLDVV